jgi:hypothetical protein
MLERIQKRVNPRIVMLHEHIPNISEHNFLNSIIRTFQGEGYPNLSSSIKIINSEFIKNIINVEPNLTEFFMKFQNMVNSVQTDINTNELIEYQNKIFCLKKRIPGVIGGHLKNISLLKKYFLKKMASNHGINEIFNYNLVYKNYPKLKPFINKCFGVIFIKNDFPLTDESLEEMINSGLSTSEDALYYPMNK